MNCVVDTLRANAVGQQIPPQNQHLRTAFDRDDVFVSADVKSRRAVSAELEGIVDPDGTNCSDDILRATVVGLAMPPQSPYSRIGNVIAALSICLDFSLHSLLKRKLAET